LAEVTGMKGDWRKLSLVVATKGTNAALGALWLDVLTVLQTGDPTGLTSADQFAGSAGAVTPSKVSENVTFGWPPIWMVKVFVCCPRLLSTMTVTVTESPQVALEGT
jgi:hypothetical protein